MNTEPEIKKTSESKTAFVVATIKPWNIEAFKKYSKNLPGKWHLIDNKDDLNIDALRQIKPRYIFFPHWSWIVPDQILQEFECVCFHMTDLPYGRGGSPLQNLIARGHTDTKLTALKMTDVLDAGPVYAKTDLSLSGKAQDIFERAADSVWHLIADIVKNAPVPTPQKGDVTEFKRRTPEMSRLPATDNVKELYDHIRMLDAQTYPHAFVDAGPWRLYFTDAKIDASGDLSASVTFKHNTQKE